MSRRALATINLTATTRGAAMGSSPNTPQFWEDKVHRGERSQDAAAVSEVDDRDSPARSGCASYCCGVFTSDNSVSSNSSYIFSHTDSNDGVSGIIHGTSSLLSCEGDEDSDEKEKVSVSDEGSPPNRNMSACSDLMGNLGVLCGVRGHFVTPEQQNDTKLSSPVSALSSAFSAGVGIHFGSKAEVHVALDHKKTGHASGSFASSLVPSICIKEALSQPRLAIPFFVSASDSSSNGPMASSGVPPLVLSGGEGGRGVASRPQLALRRRSTLFSQISLSTASDPHCTGEFSLFFKNHDCHRIGHNLSSSLLGDKRVHPVAPTDMEEVLQRCTCSHQVNRNDDSFADAIPGVWFDNDEEQSVISRRPPANDVNGSPSSFGAYVARCSPPTVSGVSREAYSGVQLDETQRKTLNSGGHLSREENNSDTDNLSHRSSFFYTRPHKSVNLSPDSLDAGKRVLPKTAFQVLSGNFDSRDASLDSRVLDTGGHNQNTLNSAGAKGPSRRPSSPLGHVLTAGSAVGRNRGSITVAGNSNNPSSRLFDASACHGAPLNAMLTNFRRASAGNPREPASVVRSVSLGRRQGLVSVVSQQTMVVGWRLLSFRELDDTPLTNIEHVPHNGRAKKKRRRKDGNKRKKHERHRKSRSVAEANCTDGGAAQGKHGDVVQNGNGIDSDATQMHQERDAQNSPAGVAQPSEGVRKSLEASRKTLDRQRPVLRKLSKGPQPPQANAASIATRPGMRLHQFKTPRRTSSAIPDGQTPPFSGTASGNRITSPAERIRSSQDPDAGHVQIANSVKSEVVRKPDRFEKFKEPPLASPSATVRRLTVRAGNRKILVSNAQNGGATSAMDGGGRPLRPGPPPWAPPSVSLPLKRRPMSLYGGTDARHAEPLQQSPSRQTDRLPLL